MRMDEFKILTRKSGTGKYKIRMEAPCSPPPGSHVEALAEEAVLMHGSSSYMPLLLLLPLAGLVVQMFRYAAGTQFNRLKRPLLLASDSA